MSSKEINQLYTRLRDLEIKMKTTREVAARARARFDKLEDHVVHVLVGRLKDVEEAVDLINFALKKAGILQG